MILARHGTYLNQTLNNVLSPTGSNLHTLPFWSKAELDLLHTTMTFDPPAYVLSMSSAKLKPTMAFGFPLSVVVFCAFWVCHLGKLGTGYLKVFTLITQCP